MLCVGDALPCGVKLTMAGWAEAGVVDAHVRAPATHCPQTRRPARRSVSPEAKQEDSIDQIDRWWSDRARTRRPSRPGRRGTLTPCGPPWKWAGRRDDAVELAMPLGRRSTGSCESSRATSKEHMCRLDSPSTGDVIRRRLWWGEQGRRCVATAPANHVGEGGGRTVPTCCQGVTEGAAGDGSRLATPACRKWRRSV